MSPEVSKYSLIKHEGVRIQPQVTQFLNLPFRLIALMLAKHLLLKVKWLDDILKDHLRYFSQFQSGLQFKTNYSFVINFEI